MGLYHHHRLEEMGLGAEINLFVGKSTSWIVQTPCILSGLFLTKQLQ